MRKYCHLHASCGWSNIIYVTDAICCFEFDLFRAQPCWFAFTNAIRKKIVHDVTDTGTIRQ